MKNSKALKLLHDLGLNLLEAEIYLFMLPQPPLTAYKIAKHLGKPSANVYKAVDTLALKGGLVVEDGTSRTCRVIPPRIFLRRAEQDFHEVSLEAQAALKDIEIWPIDEHVYRVNSVEQVYAYCREMIEKAKSVVVIDAFPLPLNRIAFLAKAAAKRGVEVFVEAYENIEIDGAQITLVPVADKVISQWSAQQLNVVIDGTENLMALFTRDGSDILQAYWSNSLYLSCLHHGGRLCEQTLVRALQAGRNGASAEEMLSIMENHAFLINKPVPGQQELSRRYFIKRDTV
jgi:HTH-type transcriptional regulator, sugar sensing transcriptional regulator